MSLKHDLSAIRYASTQEAYGQLWTLDKVEPDGAQVWKNGKGQTAMVQAEPMADKINHYLDAKFAKVMEDIVAGDPFRASKLPESPVWVLADPSTAHVPVVRHPIKDDRRAQLSDLTDPTNEQTIAEIDHLIASGIDAKYARTLEGCKQAMQSGRVSSTEENVSNGPKSEQAIEIDPQQVYKAMYLSPVDLAIRARDAKRKPGEQRVSADGKNRYTWTGTRWDKP